MIRLVKKQYDLIVVPALKLSPHFRLRKDLKARLKKSVNIYSSQQSVHIAVCGKWSIWYDWLRIKPPITESQRMKQYLISHGVDKSHIITESHSKDTIGNVYYLKLYLRDKPQYRKLLVICAKQHEPRLRFIFHKFFGNKYEIDYLTMKAPSFIKNVTGEESKLIKEQQHLLAHVRSGHEEDFKHHLYNDTYYTHQSQEIRNTIS